MVFLKLFMHHIFQTLKVLAFHVYFVILHRLMPFLFVKDMLLL